MQPNVEMPYVLPPAELIQSDAIRSVALAIMRAMPAENAASGFIGAMMAASAYFTAVNLHTAENDEQMALYRRAGVEQIGDLFKAILGMDNCMAELMGVFDEKASKTYSPNITQVGTEPEARYVEALVATIHKAARGKPAEGVMMALSFVLATSIIDEVVLDEPSKIIDETGKISTKGKLYVGKKIAELIGPVLEAISVDIVKNNELH